MTELRGRIASGIGVSGLSATVTAVAQLVQVVVLARLLGPDVFGVMAMVLVTVTIAELIGQMGLHEAMIPRREISTDEFSSLYWFSAAWGAVTYLIFLMVSPLVVMAFGEDQLATLLPVALISVLIAPFGIPFLARAQKLLEFGMLAWVDIVSALVGLAVSISGAWLWDQGVWALVWGHLSRTAARTSLIAIPGWFQGARPRFHFALIDLRGYLGFGLYRVAAMAVNLLLSRVDQILIGGVLGAQALGYYSIASNFTLLPMQLINPVITRVAFPVFAKVRDDLPLLRRGYLTLIRVLSFVNAPVLIGMAAVAPSAVPVLLGEQWQESVPLIQILAIYTLLRSIGNASGSLILGLGRADMAFVWNLGLLIVVPPIVFAASLTGSLTYIAWSMVALQAILYPALYFLIVRKLLGPCFSSFASAFAVPAGLAAAMGGLVIGLRPVFGGLPETVQLFGQVAFGVICFLSLALIFQRRYLGQLLRMVGGNPWHVSQ